MHTRPGCFVGFGFGPIQAGVFVARALRSGFFHRVVVAEVATPLVQSVRSAGGVFTLNVAGLQRLTPVALGPIEILNPFDDQDAETLRNALGTASDVALAVPCVRKLCGDVPANPLAWLARAARRPSSPIRVYVADNAPGASEYVVTELGRLGATFGTDAVFDVRATVIGKMSHVVRGEESSAERALAPLVPGFDRAFVVEEHDRIFCSIGQGGPNPLAFETPADLSPYQALKLYAHNAVHAVLGFLAALKGIAQMSELAADPAFTALAREMWLEELGPALQAAFPHTGDPWFSREGYPEYVKDLWSRMVSRSLGDRVERVIRDPARKLGYTERVFSAISFCQQWGRRPWRLSMGALAGLAWVYGGSAARGLDWVQRGLAEGDVHAALETLWGSEAEPERLTAYARLLVEAAPRLDDFIGKGRRCFPM